MTTRPRTPHVGHPEKDYKNCAEPECVAYRARYMKRWNYERAHGLKRLITSEAAHRHVNVLLGLGWSLRSIAGAAEVAPVTIMRLRDDPTKLVQKAIAAKVLAIDPNVVPSKPSTQTSEPFVSRVGTVRRIQALLFMGWPHREISRRAGIRSAPLISQQGRWVTRTTHDKVAALYDEIGMRVGPSPQTRGWAARFGYLGPLSWDDIDSDAVPQDGTELDGQEAS